VTSSIPQRLTIFIAHASELLTDHRPHGDGLVSFGFIRRLAERGHEVHVAAQEVDVRAPLPANLHLYRLTTGDHTSLRARLTFMVRMRALYQRLSANIAFDLVQQMNPVFSGLSLSLVGMRTPLILGTFVPRWHGNAQELEDTDPAWLRHTKRSIGGVVTRLQQAQASGLLLASPDAISRIAAPHRHEGHIYQVPHGIDITRFTERTAVPPRRSVLFLANVIYRKGIFTLLDAFEQVSRAVPDAELVIGGRGHQLEEVRARVATMAGCTVHVLGHVDRSEVPAMMREHAVYCLPSYGEPFATSVLEAMACGVPIVATNAGGLPHVIGPGGGRLVPPRDASALAEALIEVLTSPDLQTAMGRHNRTRIETEFEIERAVDRLESAYAAVLRQSPSASPAARSASRRTPPAAAIRGADRDVWP
jgi:L-malate glycosyltransferase